MAAPLDPRAYDPHTSQWMREALENRQVIEELKAQNDKLQREVYSLNSKVNLMYECCSDLGVIDRVGDLMQRKLHDFQMAKVARINQPTSPTSTTSTSPRSRRHSNFKLEEGFICGSMAFQEIAAFPSSYEGQVLRDNFHRRNVFEAEEAQFRDTQDIFGNPKVPSPKTSPNNRRGGDTIDRLLSSNASTLPSPTSAPGLYGGNGGYGSPARGFGNAQR